MTMPDTNTLILLFIAILNIGTALLAWMTKVAAEKTEINTNHMREQLVIATGEAAHAAGRKEKAEEIAKTNADMAEGARQAAEHVTAAATTKIAVETERLADETQRIANKPG